MKTTTQNALTSMLLIGLSSGLSIGLSSCQNYTAHLHTVNSAATYQAISSSNPGVLEYQLSSQSGIVTATINGSSPNTYDLSEQPLASNQIAVSQDTTGKIFETIDLVDSQSQSTFHYVLAIILQDGTFSDILDGKQVHFIFDPSATEDYAKAFDTYMKKGIQLDLEQDTEKTVSQVSYQETDTGNSSSVGTLSIQQIQTNPITSDISISASIN